MENNSCKRVVLPVVFCILSSCSILNEGKVDEKLSDNFPYPDGRSYAIGVSYEVETLTISAFPKNQPGPELAIHSEPLVSRNKVRVMIYRDGSSDWLIKKVRPHNGPSDLQEIPKSDYDEIATIRIINNQGYYFNSSGEMVYENYVDIPSYSELISTLIENRGANTSRIITSSLSGAMNVSETQLHELMELGNVSQMSNGYLKITSLSNYGTALRGEEGQENLTYEHYMDPETGLIVGGKAFDGEGNLVAYLAFKYSDSASGSILQMAHYKEFNEHLGEVEEIKTMNNYFENFIIDDYLNN